MGETKELAIEDCFLSELFQHTDQKGGVFHFMKQSHPLYLGFGEVYFSNVIAGVTKGWKKHKKMTCNLVVPVGHVCFHLYDQRIATTSSGTYIKVNLGKSNYQMLTIAANVWFAFTGGEQDEPNVIANFADIEHNDEEVETRPLSYFSFINNGR